MNLTKVQFREKSNEQKNGQGRADYPPNESYGLNIQSNNRDDTVLRIPEFETSKNLPQQNMPTDTALVVFVCALKERLHLPCMEKLTIQDANSGFRDSSTPEISLPGNSRQFQ